MFEQAHGSQTVLLLALGVVGKRDDDADRPPVLVMEDMGESV